MANSRDDPTIGARELKQRFLKRKNSICARAEVNDLTDLIPGERAGHLSPTLNNFKRRREMGDNKDAMLKLVLAERDEARAELAAEREGRQDAIRQIAKARDERDAANAQAAMANGHIDGLQTENAKLREALREARDLISETWADAGTDILARIDALLKETGNV